MSYRIEVSPAAKQMLLAIKDRRIYREIANRIDGLRVDPETQGKPLLGELWPFRSLRAAGQRYRIIYRIAKSSKLVWIAAVGIRREGNRQDIYKLASKLIRLFG